MVDLTIDSPAVGTEKVRLLLPPRFDSGADAEWPVLYLLHGALDDYTSWTRETDVAELVAGLDLLVAMPEAGWDGWYSDWWNGGEGGPPMWETFHLTEVRELLERNWQAGDERVVAGVSMGGLGAMTYAARHPGLFEAAASFSGVLHPTTLPFDLSPALWGDRTEQADIWEAHDPVLLADALEGIPLYVSYGDGKPGPLDADEPAADDPESWIAEMNDAFVTRLVELGIPAQVAAYGPGTHTWPYFERSLHDAMPMLLEALED
jgi:diacylglycerol O-acyltransferase / trehalose O-mycolyltransferase